MEQEEWLNLNEPCRILTTLVKRRKADGCIWGKQLECKVNWSTVVIKYPHDGCRVWRGKWHLAEFFTLSQSLHTQYCLQHSLTVTRDLCIAITSKVENWMVHQAQITRMFVYAGASKYMGFHRIPYIKKAGLCIKEPTTDVLIERRMKRKDTTSRRDLFEHMQLYLFQLCLGWR